MEFLFSPKENRNELSGNNGGGGDGVTTVTAKRISIVDGKISTHLAAAAAVANTTRTHYDTERAPKRY